MFLGSVPSSLPLIRESTFQNKAQGLTSLQSCNIGTPEVAYLVAKVSFLHSPEHELDITPTCCSDYQPFHESGFPVTRLFDPMYQNTSNIGDSEDFDFKRLRSIAKVQFAALLHIA